MSSERKHQIEVTKNPYGFSIERKSTASEKRYDPVDRKTVTEAFKNARVVVEMPRLDEA